VRWEESRDEKACMKLWWQNGVGVVPDSQRFLFLIISQSAPARYEVAAKRCTLRRLWAGH
jgi:hypothetical protein